MSTRPPERRQVSRRRDPESGEPTGRPHERSHVSLARSEAAAGFAERRRLRRLRKASSENILPPAAIPRGLPFRVYISLRWFSGAIALVLLFVLFLFFTRDAFFIHEIYVGGTKYLTPPEIFERSGLAKMHLFWVDPVEIEARLEQDASIANANVAVGWPPNMIQITITEREPALIWEQAGLRVWVDVRGRVMALRRDEKDLVRVIVEKPLKTVQAGKCPLMGMDEVLGPGSCIDPNIVAGVLQFKALYPNVTEVVYDPSKGLGYHQGGGWLLWFGDGTDIVTKMAVYNKTIESILAQGKQPIEINVSDPDAPYYSYAPK
ncbi:MAG: FtsQ-type POTRA domain-containing protein [Chloroflexota bacterium]